jgi:hypothetical protein
MHLPSVFGIEIFVRTPEGFVFGTDGDLDGGNIQSTPLRK